MKKVLAALMIIGFVFLVSGQEGNAQDVNEKTKATDETIKPQNVGNKVCPVSGEKINAAGNMKPATYEYEGKIYNFCCPGCIDEFKKDPQQYIKKVESELRADAQKEKSEQDMKGMDMGTHVGHGH